MDKLLIIDGNSILNRAYYGIRPLTAPDGTPTNAVYGFLNILFKYLDEENPDYLCVAFDVKEKTFRHKRYELYKAQRKPAPEDFLAQIPVIKEVLAAMNCLCLELPGYEADDIIGTVAKICEENNTCCRILTGDKDDLQLASDMTVIKLVITRMGKTETTDYGEAEFTAKYGVAPSSFIDIKALMGDASDNIPGVRGIGEKTAMSLIQSYNNIETIYDAIDELDVTENIRGKLASGRDDAFLSKELATIDRNAPIEFKISDAKIQEYDSAALAQLFSRLNFRSFIQKLELSNAPASEPAALIKGEGKICDMQTALENSRRAEEVCYLISGGRLCIKPKGSDLAMLAENFSKSDLAEFLADGSFSKIGFNLKEDIIASSDFGIDAPCIAVNNLKFDVMLAAYLLEPSRSDYLLEDLCEIYLGAHLGSSEGQEDSDQLSMAGLISANGESEVSALYDEVFALEMLADKLSRLIEENGQHTLYYDIELPLTEVLADLQLRGMYVDKEELERFGKALEEKIEQVQSEVYELAGREFNINSPKQLGVVLFEELKLPFGKKNKKGSYSTNVDIMEKLIGVHPIAEKVLEYRQLTKLQSTYVVGLGSVVNPKTDRIHSRFNQMVTTTGRISSTDPNMQNIPVRTPLGRELRRMFIAERPDWCLIDADYSQIELRVLAHIADDPSMKSAFEMGEDIHTSTAANVFHVPVSEVTPQMRSRAKAVNFGIVYGIGAFSLAQDIGTTRKEAENYINDYLSHYEKVSEYMKTTIENAKRDGYVRTVFGRRRYIPELKASSRMVNAFGERAAMNAPIQGSAADIIKIAMINVYRRLKKEGLAARLVLQVHDELIVEAPEAERDIAAKILREEMENAYKLSVPLVVDLNFGKSWYDTK